MIAQAQLIIGISSRALFDLRESNRLFDEQGVSVYAEYQKAHENEILDPGPAFHFVKKMLALNQLPTNFSLNNSDNHSTDDAEKPAEKLVEIILLSRNSADTGLRVFNSIEHYQLDITRAAFTNGQSPYQYIHAFGAHLFLSTDPVDVRAALEAGCCAATLLPGTEPKHTSPLVKIAFDGDAVLFSDQAERTYQQQGLEMFHHEERRNANQPLEAGPFKGFLSTLQQLQQLFPSDQCPIRTALITARQAPAHERVIRTLRSWNIRIDEALFLGGLHKGEFLRAFAADIFFDDHPVHCNSAKQHVTTGHVPHGIINI